MERGGGSDGRGRPDGGDRTRPGAAEEGVRAGDGRRRDQGRLHCAAHGSKDLLLFSKSSSTFLFV